MNQRILNKSPLLLALVLALFAQNSYANICNEINQDQIQIAEAFVSQVKLAARLNRLGAKDVNGVYEFVKDAPAIGFEISGNANDLPKAISSVLGAVDQTAYTAEYMAQNAGSYVNLQVKSDGSPDFYPVGLTTIQNKYRVLPLSEAQAKNAKYVANLSKIEGMAELIASGNVKLVSLLKTVPVKMTRLSDLGYGIDQKVTIESPWGGVQVKEPGMDGYIVQESPTKAYLVNVDAGTGLPIGYIAGNGPKFETITQAQLSATIENTAVRVEEINGRKVEIGKMIVNKYKFIKDQPGVGYRIAGTKNEIPESIRKVLGKEDQTAYTDEYIAKNTGSYINLQVKGDGSADFYPIGLETMQAKYKVLPLDEALAKNGNLVKKLRGIEGVLDVIDAKPENLVALLKTVPVKMTKMSALGFPINSEIKIESPWGDFQIKKAGQDAYIVQESETKAYMVNIDIITGYPLGYVPSK